MAAAVIDPRYMTAAELHKELAAARARGDQVIAGLLLGEIRRRDPKGLRS